MALLPIPIPGVAGVPVLRDGQQAGVAPTGYAPGTVVQMLGQQLMQPPAPVPVPIPVPQNVFQSFDENGFDGMGENFGGAQQSGSGNIAADLSLPSSLTDPIADLGLGFMNPSLMGLSMAALSKAVPALAPLGLAYSAANALGSVIGSPQTNSLGQTQQSGVGNETVDMFGNLVGSPANIASVASFNPATGSFVSPTTGETMSPAPNPDVSTPDDFSASADQAQAADPTGAFGDQFGESTASEGGDDSGKVICTELHRQGKLDDATMAADKEFGEMVAENDPHTMVGYHLWAKPVVRLMQKSRIITWIVALLALPWAREMFLRQTGNGRGSWRGRILMRLGIPVCRFIGRRNARGWLPPFRSKKHA
jgi:hypothetical protein|tara:strand:- start:50 stop:1147 length:1098 start_codon:yes stop_codon:yes gene_type:complete